MRESRLTAGQRQAIAAIAVPVSLEFVVMLIMNFVNQVIVGFLGDTAIAAVGFVNSLTFIVMVVVGALGVSVSVLLARGFGAGRREEMSHTLSVAVLLAGAASTLIVLLPILAPHAVLMSTGATPSVAATGSAYLALTAAAMIPTVISQVLSGAMRSTGHPRSPMVATFATVPINTALVYALVVGVGPFPAMGVAGAGVAMLVTALLKLGVLAVQLFGVHRTVSWQLPTAAPQWRDILTPLVILAVPMMLTELLWTGGNFFYNVVFARLGDGPLAAASIVTTIEAVFFVGSIGLMSAATALIGRSVGEGSAPESKAWVRRILRAGVWTGLVFGGAMILSIPAVPWLYPNAGSDVHRDAMIGLALFGLAQVVKVRNMLLGGGIMPSGGDIKGVILGDGIGAFVIGLPLAIILGLFTPLGILGVLLARVIEEVGKVGIFQTRTNRISWQRVVDLEAARIV